MPRCKALYPGIRSVPIDCYAGFHRWWFGHFQISNSATLSCSKLSEHLIGLNEMPGSFPVSRQAEDATSFRGYLDRLQMCRYFGLSTQNLGS